MSHTPHSSYTSVSTPPALLSPRIAVSPPSDQPPASASAALAFQFPLTSNATASNAEDGGGVNGNVPRVPAGGWRRRLSRHRPRSSSVSRSTDALVQASALALTQPLSIDIQLSGPPPVRASSASDLPCSASLLSPPPLPYDRGGHRRGPTACSVDTKTFRSACDLRFTGSGSPTATGSPSGKLTPTGKKGRGLTVDLNKSDNDVTRAASVLYSEDSTATITSSSNDSSARQSSLESNGSPGPWPPPNPGQPPPSPGPRYALIREADVQVCCLNHARTVVSKVLSSRFLRRWETLRLRLNEADIEAEEGSGLLQKPLTYVSMQDVYTVNRWDATGRYCLRIVVPEGSVLLQAASSYVRDQWFHSIVWKKNLHKYKSVLSQSRSPEIILKELKCLVDFAATTPLQDDCIMNEPIAIVSELLDQPDHICSRASLLRTSAPLLEDAPASAPLCRHVAKYCLQYYDEISSDSDCSNDSLSFSAVERLVRRILKHGADYSTSPHARDLVRDYLAAIGNGIGGRERLAAFVDSVHGPGSACPHPRVLPNLASVCFAGITLRIEQLDNEPIIQENKINGAEKSTESANEISCDLIDNLNKNNESIKTIKQPLIIMPTSNGNNTELEEQQNIKNEALNNLQCRNVVELFSNSDAETNFNNEIVSSTSQEVSNIVEDSNKSIISEALKNNLLIDKNSSQSTTKESTNSSTTLDSIVLNNKALDDTTKVLNETKQVLIQGLRAQRLLDQSREHLTGHVDEEDDNSTEDTGSYRTCLDIEFGPDCEEISLLENTMDIVDAQIQIYATVLELISNHSSWLPYLASLLQPLPFPARAFSSPGFLRAMAPTVRRIAACKQCEVHRTLMPVRPTKKGWMDLYCPVSEGEDLCPDGGKIWCLMLSTLLGCCGRRKRFLLQHIIPARLEDCFRLASQPWAGSVRLVLALVIEWDLLGQQWPDGDGNGKNESLQRQKSINEEDSVVVALMSTQRGKEVYADACERRALLEKMRRTGGPKRLALPPRSTDQDLEALLSDGKFGDLRSLCLAFTRVTGACAEQIIKLPGLRQLNLWSTQFDDAGLQILAENLPQLRQLNLCETRVTDAGIASLASLKNLRTLNLNSTSLTATTLQELRNKLPELQDCDVRYTEAW